MNVFPTRAQVTGAVAVRVQAPRSTSTYIAVVDFEKRPPDQPAPIYAKGYGSELELANGILHIKVSRAISLGGARGRKVPIRDVVAVQMKPATRLWNGYLRFLIAGDDPLPPSSKSKVAPTPGLVLFSWMRRKEFDTVRDQVEALRPDLTVEVV